MICHAHAMYDEKNADAYHQFKHNFESFKNNVWHLITLGFIAVNEVNIVYS